MIRRKVKTDLLSVQDIAHSARNSQISACAALPKCNLQDSSVMWTSGLEGAPWVCSCAEKATL